MPADELVDGDGWISDESSFYGDERTQSNLEEQARREIVVPYDFPLNHVSQPKPKKAEAKTPENQRQTKAKAESDGSVLDFLRSRPQIAALHKAAAADRNPVKQEPARSAGGEEAADLLDDDRFEGSQAAWQHRETVDDFLKRAPVAELETANLGPWVWVSNPKVSWSQKKHELKTDIPAFKDGGSMLLEAFRLQRNKVEEENPQAAPATITRKLRPHREQLEDDLLTLSVKTNTTCGKWMLFPSNEDYPRYWRLVAEATAEGKLGVTSKAATYTPTDPLNLICVYTYDFTDSDDVRRVLEGLVELGVCTQDGKPIFYKCDAYTYLHLKSDNEYRIKASLYSSKEVLGKEAKATKEGPVARLKKRNRTVDSFFSS